jgi:exoribonuclease R
MLPFQYSEGQCSLLPNKKRPGVSLILTYEKGLYQAPKSVAWKLTCVQNKQQYDYDTFISVANADGIDTLLLSDVASGLLGKRTMDPHEWIEAFMLCYNLEAAKILRQVGRGVLRKHGAPDLEKLKRYEWLGGADMAILAQQAATYCPAGAEVPFHYGLSAQAYCHASSPIRRYADLLNQRALKDVLLGSNTTVEPDIIWLNKRQKDLKRFERDTFFLSQLRIAEKAVLDGLIVEIEDKEGQVPMKKVRVWIRLWKRMINVYCSPNTVVAEGLQMRVSYFANPATRSWKDRIVFRLEV